MTSFQDKKSQDRLPPTVDVSFIYALLLLFLVQCWWTLFHWATGTRAVDRNSVDLGVLLSLRVSQEPLAKPFGINP